MGSDECLMNLEFCEDNERFIIRLGTFQKNSIVKANGWAIEFYS